MRIVQHAAHRNLQQLLEAGVRIFEYDRTLLHQKVMTVDGAWCSVGSSNFDDRSFETNDEITLGFLDRALARRLGLPFFPDTPTFPWLGPLGLLPYPVRYRIVYGEPLAFHERFGPEDASDARLVRYLANNPVRAGLCRRAADWPWSSHRQMAGSAPLTTPSLRVAELLRYFGDDPSEARTRYSRFVDRHRSVPSPLLNTRHQVFLGDAEFVDVVTAEAPRPSREVARTQRAWRTLGQYAVAHVDRDLAIAAAYRDGHHSVRAIAEHFGLHPSSISRIVRLVAESPTVRRRGRKGKVRYLPWRPDR